MSIHTGTAHESQSPPMAASSSRPVELFATVALALSTLVAVTAVSIGIARADVLSTRIDADAAPLAIALFMGLLLAAMGGLTAFMAENRKSHQA
jgi:hypothetical protein